MYNKTYLKWSLSKRPKMVFKTNYRLMQVKSIAFCSAYLVEATGGGGGGLKSIYCPKLRPRLCYSIAYSRGTKIHTDGCTEFLWLLVQPHHSIHCSYKRYINRYLSQHMIFQYQDEDSGEPMQMYRLARAFSA